MFAGIRLKLPQAQHALVLAILCASPDLAGAQNKAPVPTAPASSAPVAAKPAYAVKGSDVVVPADVKLGQYRRVTQPFPNWTLICDENLAKKQKVCNISQTIVDGTGNAAFSWSLAAAADGRPFFILRVPASVGQSGSIRMQLPDKGSEVHVRIEGCTPSVCIGYQQVGPRLKAAVEKGGAVAFAWSEAGSSEMVSLKVPLDGLNEALSSI